MLIPAKTKHKKAFKGKIKGDTKAGSMLAFGAFGLKALAPERVNSKQIEAARRAATRYMKRAGKLWIRIFPDLPVTKKPTDVRMGKGKGVIEYYVSRVKPGRIIFEMDGVSEEVAKEAFLRAQSKLPLDTKFVTRIDGN